MYNSEEVSDEINNDRGPWWNRAKVTLKEFYNPFKSLRDDHNKGVLKYKSSATIIDIITNLFSDAYRMNAGNQGYFSAWRWKKKFVNQPANLSSMFYDEDQYYVRGSSPDAHHLSQEIHLGLFDYIVPIAAPVNAFYKYCLDQAQNSNSTAKRAGFGFLTALTLFAQVPLQILRAVFGLVMTAVTFLPAIAALAIRQPQPVDDDENENTVDEDSNPWGDSTHSHSSEDDSDEERSIHESEPADNNNEFDIKTLEKRYHALQNKQSQHLFGLGHGTEAQIAFLATVRGLGDAVELAHQQYDNNPNNATRAEYKATIDRYEAQLNREIERSQDEASQGSESLPPVFNSPINNNNSSVNNQVGNEELDNNTEEGTEHSYESMELFK